MAIRQMDVEQRRTDNNGVDKVVATIFCDSKNDIAADLKIGSAVVDFGSVAYTPNLEVGLLDSTGTWTWN